MTARALAKPLVRPVETGLRGLYWLVMAGLSGLIIWNSLPYFTFARELPFLMERALEYDSLVWRVSFYVHVGGGLVCLATALPQFSRTLLRCAPHVHRALGWTYVVSVLVLTVPAGLYLAVHAHGGIAGRLGFVAIGVALFYTTWRGVEHVRRRDFKGHVNWMLRSYAMAASAITFRVFFLALYAAEVDGEYPIAVWLSFLVNLGVAELVIVLRRKGVLA